MTDYIGSILSYVIVAIPIFSGRYDNTDAVGLSVLISEVMMMMYNVGFDYV